MAAETNTIMAADLAQIRSVDFNYQFTGGLKKFMEAMGVTRKIAVQEGTSLKALKVTGTLEDGNVAEGELIPLSKYESEEITLAEAKLRKWRKATTAEAIVKSGYDDAVGETTDKALKDIQKLIRGDLFTSMGKGTGTATGTTLQKALANAWGVLQVLFEDDAVETVYFLNPQDVADYLGDAQITTQTLFGMKYIEDFLGLGSVLMNSNVPKGTFYATAKGNIIAYFINMTNGDVAKAFKLTVDETGYIGIREYLDEDTARVMDLIMTGVSFFPERIDGIVKGAITGA